MRSLLDAITANPLGAFAVLLVAAFLEAFGDACFQSGLYRSTGVSRGLYFAAGAAVLALYGLTVNVLFFLVAQILARVRFHQSPTPPIYVGGSLIVAGGLVIAFWKH
jgi:small multidrug resistance family-3 protein